METLGDDRRMGSRVPVARVEVRLPVEADRDRFVALFGDDEFMVFSDGTLTDAGAHARFDRMLANAAELPFAKQPVIERSTGRVVGYAGVDRIDLEGREWLEFGYRLVPDARGKGYATEASLAVLARGAGSYRGEILAIIDPANEASQAVAGKLGFRYWKRAEVGGCIRDLYLLRIG
jgi:RimJ/RimL family protein N-acetyltransferase